MNNINRFVKFKVFLLLCVSIIVSCQNDMVDENTPKSTIKFSLTRSVVDSTTWDQCDRCISSVGDSLYLPWAETCVCSIPLEIRKDVRADDGWRLLYSNVKMLGCNNAVNHQNGANYILLYNKYTGMLKGFYYASSVEPNNSAFWILTIPQTATKLFNFTKTFGEPSNVSSTNQVTLSNISQNALVNGIEVGWNCFMVELAYDENSLNETLDITAYALNEATLTFSDEYNSTSQGTITSQSSGMSSVFSGIVTGINNFAVSWINSKWSHGSDNQPIKINLSNLAQSLTSSTLPGLISLGVNKIFGSLLGQITTNNYSLQFTTDGNVTITGKEVKPCTGYVCPIAGIPFNGIGERLGVWNLAQAPKFQIKKDPELISATDTPISGRVSLYRVTGSPTLGIIKKNPDVDADITTTYSLVKYDRFQDGLSQFWTCPPNVDYMAVLQNRSDLGFTQTLLYNGAESEISTMPSTYIVAVSDIMPNKTTSNHIPVYDFCNSNIEIRQHIAFKLVTKVRASEDNVVYSCKTFIPVNELVHDGSTRPYIWTTNELIRRGYLE